MSIKSEIGRLGIAKSSLKTAIEGKGVAVPEGTKLDGYSGLVEQISAGDSVSSLPTITGQDSGKQLYARNSEWVVEEPPCGFMGTETLYEATLVDNVGSESFFGKFGYQTFDSNINIQVGSLYTITINNDTPIIATAKSYEGAPCLGNIYLGMSPETVSDNIIDTGEDYCILAGFGLFFFVAREAANEYHLKIESNKIKKLNNAFLSLPIFSGAGEDSIIMNDRNNQAAGSYSHAEGYGTKALDPYSHAEGRETVAMGYYSHAEGYDSAASGDHTHAEGLSTHASGNSSHSEGSNTSAIGDYSHAEGRSCLAGGANSHAEGLSVSASGESSHAEGWKSKALGDNSHAEGYSTNANGYCSHVEGFSSVAYGDYTHAEGCGTNANANYCHSEGFNTIASGRYSHVEGKYNIGDDNEKYIHIVGNGESDDSRSNAHTLDWDGNTWYAGELYLGGTGQDDPEAWKASLPKYTASDEGKILKIVNGVPTWSLE